ncbi:hypothetical protein [Paenibacillus sinopodophylli]|uniref:hypothetical protein n=1 Tax=Paenibacillus sinopodophylli TaxID=1837342 RepID=UPI0014871659|nr:hypothetical protein [Paenibacillus sinopodophylli]
MKVWELGYSYSGKETRIGLKSKDFKDIPFTGEVIVDHSKLEFIRLKKGRYKDFLSS